MLGAQTTRAIARVEVDGGLAPSKRGTAFLITSKLVLTAAHVVEGAVGIKLFFEAGRVTAHITAATPAHVYPVDRGLTDDWTLLECTEPPPNTLPLPVDALVPAPGRITWDTYGYALYGKPGGNFTGIVRNVGPFIDLRCDEIDGQPEEKVNGISGAPCVVDGIAVGLIVVGRSVHGTTVGASLQAVPSEMIVAAHHDVLQIDSIGPYPYDAWFEDVVATLGAGARTSLANALGLSGERRGHALVRRIARALHDAGTDGILRAILTVPYPDRAKLAHIARLARSLWIKEQAARRLGECLNSPVRAAAVNARLAESGEDYHARAWWSWQKASPKHEPLQLKNRTGETQIDELRQELRMVLYDAFTPADDQELRESLAVYGPVTILVPDEAPIDEVIGKLAAEFPGVQFLLLTHPTEEAAITSLCPSITYLSPGHPKTEEDAARRRRSQIDKLVEKLRRQI